MLRRRVAGSAGIELLLAVEMGRDLAGAFEDAFDFVFLEASFPGFSGGLAVALDGPVIFGRDVARGFSLPECAAMMDSARAFHVRPQ